MPWYDSYWRRCSLANGTAVNAVLWDLDIKFQGRTFRNLISTKRWELTSNVPRRLQRLMFTVNVVLGDLELNFQGQIFETLISLKRSPGTNSCYDFHRGWHSPSNGVIANVVINDLDLNFQGKQIQMLTSRKWWKPAKTV